MLNDASASNGAMKKQNKTLPRKEEEEGKMSLKAKWLKLKNFINLQNTWKRKFFGSMKYGKTIEESTRSSQITGCCAGIVGVETIPRLSQIQFLVNNEHIHLNFQQIADINKFCKDFPVSFVV